MRFFNGYMYYILVYPYIRKQRKAESSLKHSQTQFPVAASYSQMSLLSTASAKWEAGTPPGRAMWLWFRKLNY